MKKTFLFLLLLPVFATAQNPNLVPNPSFEQYKELPCSWLTENMKDYAENWESPTTSTPDLMSDQVERTCYAHCQSKSEASHGSQKPRTGHNMVMLTIYGGGGCEFPNYREYVSVKLNAALTPGKKYYAEMWISLTDHSGYASNNIGMCFFEENPYHSGDCVLNGNPQVNETKIIEVDKDWVKVSGTFVADKKYRYLAIGNFFDGEVTDVRERPDSVLNPHYDYWTHQSAQFFVDDILVKEASNLVVKGDSLVPVNSTAVLTASGCKTYSWADAADPGKIIAKGPTLTVPMPNQRTFIVYSDCDSASKVVDVIIPKPKVDSIPPVVVKKDPDPRPDPNSKFNGRKVRKGQTIIVTHRTITVTLYDNNKVDGDSISLWYGDQCIVKDLALTKKKVSFEITLDTTSQSQLVLYAENQGSIPPNTAGVIISDGRKKTEIVLSSDLRTCDSVSLVFRKPD